MWEEATFVLETARAGRFRADGARNCTSFIQQLHNTIGTGNANELYTFAKSDHFSYKNDLIHFSTKNDPIIFCPKIIHISEAIVVLHTSGIILQQRQYNGIEVVQI